MPMGGLNIMASSTFMSWWVGSSGGQLLPKITRSAPLWLMSRSSHNATFSSAVTL